MADRQGLRRLDPGNLRSISGTADLRTVRARPRGALGRYRTDRKPCWRSQPEPESLTRALAARLPRIHAAGRDRSQPADARSAPRRVSRGRPGRMEAGLMRWAAAVQRIQSFDAAACQFGVMFFPDKVQGYREARRMLRRAAAISSMCGIASRTNEFADVGDAGAGRGLSRRSAAFHRPHADTATTTVGRIRRDELGAADSATYRSRRWTDRGTERRRAIPQSLDCQARR